MKQVSPSRAFRGRRFATFSAVGLSVTAVSYVTLIAQIELLDMAKPLAYAVQALIAIELNFLLNHLITWRDRAVHSKRELGKRWLAFHAARVVTIPFNQALFTALTGVGVQYLVANTACIGATTVLTFVAGEKLIFRKRESGVETVDRSASEGGKCLTPA
ncbi:MAG: GtrA family protein [Actinobacteria bacterium]|nr:GtrA family protein [Actinomycetota bacterium]